MVWFAQKGNPITAPPACIDQCPWSKNNLFHSVLLLAELQTVVTIARAHAPRNNSHACELGRHSGMEVSRESFGRTGGSKAQRDRSHWPVTFRLSCIIVLAPGLVRCPRRDKGPEKTSCLLHHDYLGIWGGRHRCSAPTLERVCPTSSPRVDTNT